MPTTLSYEEAPAQLAQNGQFVFRKFIPPIPGAEEPGAPVSIALVSPPSSPIMPYPPSQAPQKSPSLRSQEPSLPPTTPPSRQKRVARLLCYRLPSPLLLPLPLALHMPPTLQPDPFAGACGANIWTLRVLELKAFENLSENP